MRAIKERYGYPEGKTIEFHEHPLRWWDEWNFEPQSELKQMSRILLSVLFVCVAIGVAVGLLTWIVMAIPGWLWWLAPAGAAWLVYRWVRWSVKP